MRHTSLKAERGLVGMGVGGCELGCNVKGGGAHPSPTIQNLNFSFSHKWIELTIMFRNACSITFHNQSTKFDCMGLWTMPLNLQSERPLHVHFSQWASRGSCWPMAFMWLDIQQPGWHNATHLNGMKCTWHWLLGNRLAVRRTLARHSDPGEDRWSSDESWR